VLPDVSCRELKVCVDDRCPADVETDLSVVGLDLVASERAENRSTRGRSAEDEDVDVCGDDLVMLWAPSRLPMLSVPRELPALNVCDSPPCRLSSLGENRNVLTEDEPDRSEPMLRELHVLEPKLPTDPPPADGPGEVKECCDGAVENGRSPPPKALGLEPNDGADGADRDGLKEGPDWLEKPRGEAPEPDDGLGLPEKDLWKPDAPAVPRPAPSDLSRPCSSLLAGGESSTAISAAATAARELIFFSANILLLLPEPMLHTAPAQSKPTAAHHNSTVFKALRFHSAVLLPGFSWAPGRTAVRLGNPFLPYKGEKVPSGNKENGSFRSSGRHIWPASALSWQLT
jgi:hypothetical protein